MTRITKHSKERIVQRIDDTSNFNEAKRIAKQAWTSGATINKFIGQPQFFHYLQRKRDQTRDCTIRVYRDNIFIWKGKSHKLITAHPIPERFKETNNDC